MNNNFELNYAELLKKYNQLKIKCNLQLDYIHELQEKIDLLQKGKKPSQNPIITLRLRSEHKIHLNNKSSMAGKSVTEYINDLILADMLDKAKNRSL